MLNQIRFNKKEISEKKIQKAISNKKQWMAGIHSECFNE